MYCLLVLMPTVYYLKVVTYFKDKIQSKQCTEGGYWLYVMVGSNNEKHSSRFTRKLQWGLHNFPGGYPGHYLLFVFSTSQTKTKS